VVGAADANPEGVVDAFAASQPAPYDFYSGWVDEVRVWNNARSQPEIVTDILARTRMKQADVDLDPTPAETNLVYLFTFDDLQDPQHDGISPEGFDVTMSAIRPIDWPAIRWWSGANDRSRVYSDYMYLPWVQNTVAHTPMNPPVDVGDPNVFQTTVITNLGGSTTTNVTLRYPNTGNPYGNFYLSAPSELNEASEQASDLLPLRWAEADQDIEMWDGLGPDTDTDGDGMPDWWEELYELNPQSSTDPDADPDADGLVNLYEYLARAEYSVPLDPWKFGTFSTNFVSDYFMVALPTGLTYGETYDDMDDLPDIWEREFRDVMSRVYYERDQDPDGDGWNNQEEYLVATDPSDPYDRPNPVVAGYVRYSGVIDNNGSANGAANYVHVLAYGTPGMDLEPIPATVVEVPNVNNVIYFTFDRGVPAREIYILAYKSDEENQNQPFRAGDDYGVVGPIFVGLTGDTNVEVNIMTEPEIPWFRTFEWDNPVGVSDVFIRLLNMDLGTQILTRWVHLDRSWYETVPGSYPSATSWRRGEQTAFHAADYQQATPTPGMNFQYGLPPGNYKWQAASNSLPLTSMIFAQGTFSVANYPLPAVSLVTPFGGDIVRHQIHTFKWQTPNPSYVPRFEIAMGPASGAWVVSRTIAAPWHDMNGVCAYSMPAMADSDDLFGDENWPDGQYRWRVRPHNNASAGSWSAYGLFELRVNDPGSAGFGVPQITGHVTYHGKASTNRVFVQAYESPSFQGKVDGQSRLSHLGTFTIQGLRNKMYYLYAYLDLNANGKPDEWEPQGMARDSGYGLHYEYRGDRYMFGAFSLETRNDVAGVSIVIRDRDTDNDNVPDGWEWEYMHNSPHGMFHTGDEDLDGDGLSNLREYALDTDPTDADSDGDGLSDGDEADRYGSNPTLVDSDGDGLSDGAEVSLGLNPRYVDDDFDGVPTAVELAWGGDPTTYVPGADLDPSAFDTDGDGVGDLMEIAAGTNPLNGGQSGQVFIRSLMPVSNGGASATWDIHDNVRSVDVTFVLQFSPNLALWADVEGLTSDGDTDATVSITDGVNRGDRGFYRLSLEIE
jgi:hypothetical protein